MFDRTSPGGIILPVTPDELRQTIYEAVEAALRERSTGTPPEAPSPTAELLTVDDATRLLDVTKQTLRRWELRGIIRPVRLGRRCYYRRADIDKALQGGKTS